MYRAVFILLGLACAHTARALDVFRRPPGAGPTGDFSDNPTYIIGQNVTFMWDSDYTMFDIDIYNDRDRYHNRIAERWTSKQLTWEVSDPGPIAYGDPLSYVFYLLLLPSGIATSGTTSHYFNLTFGTTTSSSIAAIPSATSTVSTLSSHTSTPTKSPPVQTSSLGQQAKSGMSGGTAAGIAVGAILGALILSGLGYFLWRRHSGTKHGATGGDDKAGGVFEPTDYSNQPYAVESNQPYTAD